MKLLERIRERYSLVNLHDALIVWYAETKLDIDPDVIMDPPHIVEDSFAEGVDALLVDKEKHKLIFVQAKTVESFDKTSNAFPENDLKLTLSGVGLLLRGEYQGKITPDLERLMKEFAELEEDEFYETKVLFLAMKKDPNSMKFVEQFKEEYNAEVEFVNFAKLVQVYNKEYLQRQKSPPPELSFTVVKNVLRKDEPFKARVFTTRAEQLARYYRDYGDRLFQQDVRFFLGDEEDTINAGIIATASNLTDAKNFWYFNNGVTITCDEIPNLSSEHVIGLRRPQIINGAQTTHALYVALEKGMLQPGTEVLIKAIQSTDGPFLQNVTRFTNSQNPIRARDFLSNDPTQISVQTSLRPFGYFFERKRGEFDSMYRTEDERKTARQEVYTAGIIDNVDAAQAYMALYLDKPSQAKAEKAGIFSQASGGYYDLIFDGDVEYLAQKILASWKLANFVKKMKSEYRKLYNEASADPRRQRNVYRRDFLLYNEYFILNLYKDFLNSTGIDVLARDGVFAILEIVNTNADMLSAIYGKIVRRFSSLTVELRRSPGYSPSNFYKSETSLAVVRKSFNARYPFVKLA